MKKFVFPLVFSMTLTGYAVYSVLDTLVLESGKTVTIDVNKEGEGFTFTKPNPNENNENNNNQNNNNNENNNNENNGNNENGNSNNENIEAEKQHLLYNYNSPGLKLDIFKKTIETKKWNSDKTTYQLMNTIIYYADVKITDLNNFHTSFAYRNGSPVFKYNVFSTTSEIATNRGAIFAISGDNCAAREKGYVVRNGSKPDTKLRNTPSDRKINREDLVVWGDGSFGTFYENDVSLAEIIDNPLGAWQVFSFGPALVKESSVSVGLFDEINDKTSTLGNQRCSVGIIEPYHYFMAVCDGRLKDSYGMSLFEMGTFMKEHGVKVAYNLDGGGSATIWYQGKVLNRPNTNGERDLGEREISDIIFFQ